jgi:glyoxalase family protein
MPHTMLGLHHVTATVDEAQADLDFCLDLLGLRLVKKTVNFDNRQVYHFYYGTERGAPGTIWTTFPYKGKGVRIGTKGAGQVVATTFSVPAGSLETWRQRFRERGVAVEAIPERFGEPGLVVHDPSGLRLELLGTGRDRRDPWPGGGLAPEQAIRGLHGVTAVVAALEPTLEMFTGLLGFQVVGREGHRTRLCAGGDAPGHVIDIVVDPQAGKALNGIGTVHHVAVAIATAEEQARLRADLVAMGVSVTGIRDRCYFQSIYFREPGGVLIEVATVQPGFTVDEDLSVLGRGLKLPPWEEPLRADIEGGLPPIVYR